MKIITISLLSLLFTMSVNADDTMFNTIQSVEVYEVVTDEDGQEIHHLVNDSKIPNVYERLAKTQGVTKVGIGDILMKTRKIIALGKEIYEIVKAGKPVVDIVEATPVEVLPHDNGVAIPAVELSGWNAPVSKKYLLKTKNYLGMSPVVFEFMLLFSYGGSNQGVGAYITGAQIKPTRVSVKWGYNFSAKFKVQTIVNEGSMNDPVAGVVLMMDNTIQTVLQEERMSKTFYINGLGQVNAY